MSLFFKLVRLGNLWSIWRGRRGAWILGEHGREAVVTQSFGCGLVEVWLGGSISVYDRLKQRGSIYWWGISGGGEKGEEFVLGVGGWAFGTGWDKQ